MDTDDFMGVDHTKNDRRCPPPAPPFSRRPARRLASTSKLAKKKRINIPGM